MVLCPSSPAFLLTEIAIRMEATLPIQDIALCREDRDRKSVKCSRILALTLGRCKQHHLYHEDSLERILEGNRTKKIHFGHLL